MFKVIDVIKTKSLILSPWTAHLVTASGLVFAFASIVAVLNSQWRLALMWMTAGVVTDALDGTIARHLNSTQKLPHFNGSLLDAIVDYVTYVVVPVLFIYIAKLIPDSYINWVLPLVLLASSYQFAQTNAKTPDNYFLGFPSYWNVAVFYMLVLKSNPSANLFLLLILIVLIFVPIKYYYPSRTRKYKFLVMSVALLWGASGISLIITYPAIHPIPLWIMMICSAFYIYLSVTHTISNRAGQD